MEMWKAAGEVTHIWKLCVKIWISKEWPRNWCWGSLIPPPPKKGQPKRTCQSSYHQFNRTHHQSVTEDLCCQVSHSLSCRHWQRTGRIREREQHKGADHKHQGDHGQVQRMQHPTVPVLHWLQQSFRPCKPQSPIDGYAANGLPSTCHRTSHTPLQRSNGHSQNSVWRIRALFHQLWGGCLTRLHSYHWHCLTSIQKTSSERQQRIQKQESKSQEERSTTWDTQMIPPYCARAKKNSRHCCLDLKILAKGKASC